MTFWCKALLISVLRVPCTQAVAYLTDQHILEIADFVGQK